jgi:hypothetical protein
MPSGIRTATPACEQLDARAQSFGGEHAADRSTAEAKVRRERARECGDSDPHDRDGDYDFHQ